MTHQSKKLKLCYHFSGGTNKCFAVSRVRLNLMFRTGDQKVKLVLILVEIGETVLPPNSFF